MAERVCVCMCGSHACNSHADHPQSARIQTIHIREKTSCHGHGHGHGIFILCMLVTQSLIHFVQKTPQGTILLILRGEDETLNAYMHALRMPRSGDTCLRTLCVETKLPVKTERDFKRPD
jgi:hypothetical protein